MWLSSGVYGVFWRVCALESPRCVASSVACTLLGYSVLFILLHFSLALCLAFSPSLCSAPRCTLHRQPGISSASIAMLSRVANWQAEVLLKAFHILFFSVRNAPLPHLFRVRYHIVCSYTPVACLTSPLFSPLLSSPNGVPMAVLTLVLRCYSFALPHSGHSSIRCLALNVRGQRSKRRLYFGAGEFFLEHAFL